MDGYIFALADYAVDKALVNQYERGWAVNRILEVLGLDSVTPAEPISAPLSVILSELTGDAVSRGICADDISSRDLFDTKLMGALMPPPREVRRRFSELFDGSPEKATDWLYEFSQDTNYIRRDRIERDMKWTYDNEYGKMEITVNLAKPEKDPKAIAASVIKDPTAYPKCQLCAENEGYAGRIDHPAKQNLRLVPLSINGRLWYMQYSPYVYFREHCIVFNSRHVPMKIDRDCLRGLLEFVEKFPHYFIGSNADLPIVGGSILSHDHFQGGRHTFAMESAEAERALVFSGYPDVNAGILKWPMSVIRLSCSDPERLIELADKVLRCWRVYTDTDSVIFSETGGEQHNTVTPIARKRGGRFELDLVLRNNLTTPEHPLGLYHPHETLHHIKKENIGLIEVMGLAVLPSRLLKELSGLADALLSGGDILKHPELAKHAEWADGLKKKYHFTPENVLDILKQEVGAVFVQVLTDSGVFKRNAAGRAAFLRFAESVNETKS